MEGGKTGWWEVDGGRWKIKKKEPSRSEAARFIKGFSDKSIISLLRLGR